MKSRDSAHGRHKIAARHLKPVLIDTSAWILALREGGPLRARDEIGRLLAEDRAATAGIIKLELLADVRTEREYRELKQDLEALPQLAITLKTWDVAAQIAHKLRRKGTTVPSADALIAAIARENGCELLHADRHFDLMVEQKVGLARDSVISLLE